MTCGGAGLFCVYLSFCRRHCGRCGDGGFGKGGYWFEVIYFASPRTAAGRQETRRDGLGHGRRFCRRRLFGTPLRISIPPLPALWFFPSKKGGVSRGRPAVVVVQFTPTLGGRGLLGEFAASRDISVCYRGLAGLAGRLGSFCCGRVAVWTVTVRD